MTEIKPVYQVLRSCEWEDGDKEDYDYFKSINENYVRILYPAAAYEALQKELAQAKEESQNYENATRIVQEWNGQMTLANGELRKENAELKAEIENLKTERQIMQDTNLAVVRRLQSKIDSLERDAKKDARRVTNMQQEAKDSDDSWYNCGEL